MPVKGVGVFHFQPLPFTGEVMHDLELLPMSGSGQPLIGSSSKHVPGEREMGFIPLAFTSEAGCCLGAGPNGRPLSCLLRAAPSQALCLHEPGVCLGDTPAGQLCTVPLWEQLQAKCLTGETSAVKMLPVGGHWELLQVSPYHASQGVWRRPYPPSFPN